MQIVRTNFLGGGGVGAGLIKVLKFFLGGGSCVDSTWGNNSPKKKEVFRSEYKGLRSRATRAMQEKGFGNTWVLMGGLLDSIMYYDVFFLDKTPYPFWLSVSIILEPLMATSTV